MPVSASTSAIFRSSRLEIRSLESSEREDSDEESAAGESFSDDDRDVELRRDPRSSRERRRGLGESSESAAVEAGAVEETAAGAVCDDSGSAVVAVVRRVRLGRVSRGGAGSLSSPEPKSSVASAAAGALADSVAVRRRRVGADGASSLEAERAAERRRGRWVVPSESELLVGIGNPETVTEGNAV